MENEYKDKLSFTNGLVKGIPIFLGYLATSIAFGVMCVNNGITPLISTIISVTNITSAGQFAGIKIIAEAGGYIELAITVLLINLRYSLMSISLSQRIDPSLPLIKRLIISYGITDEVYAVSVSETKDLTFRYLLGLILLPIIGWTLGTAIGAIGGMFLPEKLLLGLQLALYAMFVSIIIPDAKKNKAVFLVILIATALSCCFYYIPYIKEIGFGFKIIISSLISSIIIAIIFPIKKKVEENEE